MAYIYLGIKRGPYVCYVTSNVKVSINISKNKFDECDNVEVVTYHIKYDGSYNDKYLKTSINITNYYKLFIYTGSRINSKEYLYDYRPYNNSDVVRQINSYYYISNSDLPFAFVFITRDNKKKYYSYKQLKAEGGSNALKGTIINESELSARLKVDYENFKDHDKLLFTLGPGKDKNINAKPQSICKDKKYKKVTFSPKPGSRTRGGLVLFSANLFTQNPKNRLENKNPHYPDEVKDKRFNAVIVYYTDSSNDPNDLALLIEFLSDCDKIHIKRTNNNPTRWLKEKVDYNDDNQLVKELELIKKESENAITFKLEKNVNSPDYNFRRIVVNWSRNHNFNFIEYKHTPTSDYKNKTSLLFYNGSNIELITKNSIIENERKLETLDNQKFSEIRTYVVTGNEKEHLLIKLTSDDKTKYYIHRFNKDGTEWKQLSVQELKLAGIPVTDESNEDMSQKLETLVGKSHHINVKTLLKFISFSLNSIIILLDEKSPYDQSNINSIINNEIPPIDIEKNIILVDTNHLAFECIKPYYKVYKHNLLTAGRSARTKSHGVDLYLRFYLNGKYVALFNNSEATPSYLTYSLKNNDLYVYYYGDKDPRPLLFCYNDQAYRPYSLDDYDKKWVKVEKIKCECQINVGEELLSELSRVIRFLNPVQLEKRPGGTTENGYNQQIQQDELYDIHKFKNKNIQIKMTYQKVDSFEVFKHEPKEEGYRLGVIKYESSQPADMGLTYDLKPILKSVTAYFYAQKNQHPLLVELEFKGDDDISTYTEHYYSLGNEKKWNKMQNDERNKDFIERMKELDKTNEKLIKPVREEKGLKSQASSGGSDTRSHAATIQPSLAKAASPKTVPVQLSSQEPSSSSTVSQKLPPRDRPSDDISQLTGPIEDGPSEDSFSRNATPEKETLEEKSRLDLQEQGSGQQLRVNEEEHSSPGLNDRQLEPTPAQASNTHTAQEEDGRETLYANKHNAESQILRQKVSLIENKMVEITQGFNDSANQDNVPLIAGGAASGVGLIGSVVGYFAYTKYCKAKAPIQK